MNDENLIPLNRRPTDEAREIQRQGDKASGEARRRKKEMRQLLQSLIDEDARQAESEQRRPRESGKASKRERTKSEPRKQAVQEFAESVTDVISRMTPHTKNSADYLEGFAMARACALELIRSLLRATKRATA